MFTLRILDTKKGVQDIPVKSIPEARKLVSGMSASGKGTLLESGVVIDQSQSVNIRAKQSPSAPEGV